MSASLYDDFLPKLFQSSHSTQAIQSSGFSSIVVLNLSRHGDERSETDGVQTAPKEVYPSGARSGVVEKREPGARRCKTVL